MATSREVLEQFGNMSSPTVLFILQLFLSRNAPAAMCHAGIWTWANRRGGIDSVNAAAIIYE